MKHNLNKVVLRTYTAERVVKSQLSPESKHQLLNFIQHEASDAQIITMLLDGRIVKIDEEAEKIAMDRFVCSKHYNKILELQEQKIKIPVEHPGMLEVPEGKKVNELPLSHFQALVKKKGHESIARALTNLITWNKTKNPELSKWADNMQNQLTASTEKQREKNPEFAK